MSFGLNCFLMLCDRTSMTSIALLPLAYVTNASCFASGDHVPAE